MFNTNALTAIISAYKKNFKSIHTEEIYKWKAVKHFQENWDENAAGFPSMLSRALGKAENLLDSYNFYPMGMIRELADSDAKAVRAMFTALFNELNPVIDRIENFIESAEALRLKHGGGSWNHHYQLTPNFTEK